MTAHCTSDEAAMIHALADDELSPAERARVEEHVAQCASCRSALAAVDDLRNAVREHLPRHNAPSALRARISAAVRQASADSPISADAQTGGEAPAAAHITARAGTRQGTPSAVTPLRAPLPPSARAWRWGALAATALLAVALGHDVYSRSHAITPEEVAVREVVANHVRALMPGHLLDVASTDEHNVKPWFAGRLDFSPNVPDLTAQGFPLLGARLDYVGQHPAAALVYGRRKHVIDVLTWRSDDARDRAPVEYERNGYHVVQWSQDGAVYWATSDVAWPDLRAFVREFASAPGRL